MQDRIPGKRSLGRCIKNPLIWNREWRWKICHGAVSTVLSTAGVYSTSEYQYLLQPSVVAVSVSLQVGASSFAELQEHEHELTLSTAFVWWSPDPQTF